MTAEPWHLDLDTLDRYAAFTLAPSGRASVETHLQSCATCRARVADTDAATALAPRLDTSWARTADRIDAPRSAWLRVIGALGVPEHLARLIGASAAFRAAWLVAVMLAIGAAVAVAHGDLGPVPFLLLSPLVPVVGVAATFGGSSRANDFRAFELATPYGELRLVLLRSAAVTATSIILLGAATLLVPTTGPEAVAWLLPALALTTTTLALTTRFAPERAASAVAVGWLLLVAALAVELPRESRPTATDLGAIAAPLQGTALVLLVVSGWLFLARRDQLELPTR
jgi:hypothetical protein